MCVHAWLCVYLYSVLWELACDCFGLVVADSARRHRSPLASHRVILICCRLFCCLPSRQHGITVDGVVFAGQSSPLWRMEGLWTRATAAAKTRAHKTPVVHEWTCPYVREFPDVVAACVRALTPWANTPVFTHHSHPWSVFPAVFTRSLWCCSRVLCSGCTVVNPGTSTKCSVCQTPAAAVGTVATSQDAAGHYSAVFEAPDAFVGEWTRGVYGGSWLGVKDRRTTAFKLNVGVEFPGVPVAPAAASQLATTGVRFGPDVFMVVKDRCVCSVEVVLSPSTRTRTHPPRMVCLWCRCRCRCCWCCVVVAPAGSCARAPDPVVTCVLL